MQSLKVLLKSRGDEGSALPPVFGALDDLGVKFNRSQVSMIAAGPGVGKSAFALNYAVRAKLNTLYLSPDSDLMMLSSRVLASTWNISLRDAVSFIEQDDYAALKTISEATQHMRFDFGAGPTLYDVKDNVDAYAHVHGCYPELIVLDNLKDVQNDGGEYERFNETIDFCHQMARKTSAHVMILHHVIGVYENGDVPVPFNGLVQKPGKSVRLVLTLFRVQPGVLGVRVVKSNNSKASGDATFGCDIGFDPERMYWTI